MDSIWKWYNNYNFPYYFVEDICVSTDSMYCEGLTGFAEPPVKKASIKFYPNPVVDKVTISCNYNSFEVTIRSLTGDIHLQSKNKNTMSLCCLPPGIYILQFKADDASTQFIKILKE